MSQASSSRPSGRNEPSKATLGRVRFRIPHLAQSPELRSAGMVVPDAPKDISCPSIPGPGGNLVVGVSACGQTRREIPRGMSNGLTHGQEKIEN